MMAIIAMLSDIPMYIAQMISEITGADTSEFINAFNGIYAKVIELAESILK